VRFKTDLKVARLSDGRICRGRELQLLGEDTQKARETKEDLAQGGTPRRWSQTSRWPYRSIRSANCHV